MLFIASRALERHADGATRTSVIERLEDRGLTPLIRAARLHLFDLALLKSERAREMEAAVAARAEVEGDAPYVRGELFCFRDFAHYLIFGEPGSGAPGVRAGIIYESETADPQQKLDEFCRNVTEALGPARSPGGAANGGKGANGTGGANGSGGGDGADGAPTPAWLAAGAEWKERESDVPEVFRRFAAEGHAPLFATRGEMVEGWLKTAGMLEDTEARRWLMRLNDAHQGGRGTTLRAQGEGDSLPEQLLARFASAGLVRREILVSCRKAGRALFRLPSPDAFNTLGSAICSECGAAIADEKAEEVVVPTSLTATLLQDASWLTTHLRAILAKLGLPERHVAARQSAEGEAESQLMANVCGEPFLFLLRDGDWTGTDARRAVEEHGRAEEANLVVIATGHVQDDARQRLREHARRRAHGGRGSELLMIDGMDAVAAELQAAFERACHRALGRELWELDASLGLSVGSMLVTRARLLRGEGEPRDSAAPAATASAAAAAGSPLEF